MNKTSHVMRVIAEPAPNSRVVIIAPPDGPAMTGVGEGEGPLNYICGKCGITLLASIGFEQVQNMVFRCAKCATFNEAAPTGEMN